MNKKRKQLCLNYLKARKAFREVCDYDAILHGNDNLVGRIGEAIAHSFLEQSGRHPTVITHQSNKGYDITCDMDGLTKVSVKMITSENKGGTTSKINHKWDELIGIELGEDLKVKNFATITRSAFIKEQKRKNQSLEPKFNRNMFYKDGVFGVAGNVLPVEAIEKYDLI